MEYLAMAPVADRAGILALAETLDNSDLGRRGGPVEGKAIDENAKRIGVPGTAEAGRERPQSHLKGILLIVLPTFCFVALGALAKTLTQSYPMAQVVWARYLFHVLITVAVLAAGRRLSLRTKRLKLQIYRSMLLIAATVSFFTALAYMPLIEASVIAHAAPLVVTALSVPLLRETVGPWRWSAVAVGFIGVVIVVRPGLGVVHPAAFLVLITAVCFALYQIATRRLSTTDDALTTLLYTGVTGAVATSLAVPFFWRTPDLVGWVLMALTGAFGGLSHFLLIKAHHLSPVSVLSPFLYTQLLWAVGAGMVFFGEIPDGWTVGGAIVIAASGLFILVRERRRRPAG